MSAVRSWRRCTRRRPTSRSRAWWGGHRCRSTRGHSDTLRRRAGLAYNGLSAPYRRDGAFLVAAASAHLREIVLRVGQTGRPRLRVGTTDLPLYQAGEGTRLVITVAPSP